MRCYGSDILLLCFELFEHTLFTVTDSSNNDCPPLLPSIGVYVKLLWSEIFLTELLNIQNHCCSQPFAVRSVGMKLFPVVPLRCCTLNSSLELAKLSSVEKISVIFVFRFQKMKMYICGWRLGYNPANYFKDWTYMNNSKIMELQFLKT